MNNKKRYKLDVIRAFSAKPRSKKGQITIFIILGILMLLALVLVIALKKEVISFKTEEIIPTEKGKVENFITTCMDQVGEDALLIIGSQGGYIKIPEDSLNDANYGLKISPIHTVPFWASGPNVNVPSILLIKERIDTYIEENLRPCLFDLEAFQESYDLIEKSDITANTEIVESKVIFNVHWDVEVRNKGGEVVSEVINHVTENPAKLKRLHKLAERIIEKEMDTLKLEDLTQDLIALEHPKVPAAGMTLSCNKKTWSVKEAEETLLELVRVNLRQLRIKDTDVVEFPTNYYPAYEDGLTYYDNHYVWDLGDDYADSDVNVIFNFDSSFPYVFAVTPVSGSKLKSSSLGGAEQLSFLCIQSWKFTYDLMYPVTVNLRDETTGYNFNMAFTVHLVANQPSRGNPESRPSYMFPTETLEDYCVQRKVPMTVKTYEFVENGQGVAYTEDLDEVDVEFSCLQYQCEIGKTEYDYAGLGYAGFSTNFPYCVGGILRGTKDSYKEDWQRVVTKDGQEVELNLIPTIKVPLSKIKIVKHELFIGGDLLFGNAESATQDELALITMKLQPWNYSEKEITHDINFVRSSGLSDQFLEDQKVELMAKADFTYDVEVHVFNEEEFVGGYKGEWTVPWNKLENVNEIIFHTITKKNPNEDEMVELMLGLKEHSLILPKPEVK